MTIVPRLAVPPSFSAEAYTVRTRTSAEGGALTNRLPRDAPMIRSAIVRGPIFAMMWTCRPLVRNAIANV